MLNLKTLIFILLLPIATFAQDDEASIEEAGYPQNVIKVDIGPLAYKNKIGLIYERIIFYNLAIGVGTDVLLKDYKMNGLKFLQQKNLVLGTGNGYGFHLQFKRFSYFAFDSFYSSARIGYKKYTLNSGSAFELWTASFGFGYQFFIKEKISITLGADTGFVFTNDFDDSSISRETNIMVGLGYAF